MTKAGGLGLRLNRISRDDEDRTMVHEVKDREGKAVGMWELKRINSHRIMQHR